jgi:hypothetical protein
LFIYYHISYFSKRSSPKIDDDKEISKKKIKNNESEQFRVGDSLTKKREFVNLGNCGGNYFKQL